MTPITQKENIKIIGIAVRTTNKKQKAAKDIPALWGSFTSKNIAEQIPNKVNHNIYGIYTEYEGDYTQPYTAIIGCEVTSLDNIPEGMISVELKAGSYSKFEAIGLLEDGIVYKKWEDIWKTPLSRAYTADYEVYDFSQNKNEDFTVPIYIAIKD